MDGLAFHGHRQAQYSGRLLTDVDVYRAFCKTTPSELMFGQCTSIKRLAWESWNDAALSLSERADRAKSQPRR